MPTFQLEFRARGKNFKWSRSQTFLMEAPDETAAKMYASTIEMAKILFPRMKHITGIHVLEAKKKQKEKRTNPKNRNAK